MKLKLITYIIACFPILNVFACLDARQYKIFPVGVINDQIVTIDANLRRTHSRLPQNNENIRTPDVMWIIKSYVSVYDKHQNLICRKPIDEIEVFQRKYLSALQSLFNEGMQDIRQEYQDIDYFETEYISFCDFQKNCRLLKVEHDTLNEKDFLVYKSKKHAINFKEYNNYYNSALFTSNLMAYHLSSVRIFKTKTIELVIGHLETGHEISMGWITSDPNKKPKDEYDTVILAKEHTPKIPFDTLETSAYEEPLLHHGYGFDFFVVTN